MRYYAEDDIYHPAKFCKGIEGEWFCCIFPAGRNLATKVNAAKPARPPHESKAAEETLVSHRLIKQVYASMQTASH